MAPLPARPGATELPALDTSTSNSAQQGLADKSETEMQQHWDELISKNMDLPDGYTKVSVQIIKWKDGLDQLKVESEVQQLRALFENTFRYETEILELGIERTQLQLVSGVTNFAHRNGGDGNMLIVYYAGHGIFHKEEGLLELSPTNEDFLPGQALSKVFWNPAERHFIDDVDADVLSIMDCCFSSNLVRNVVETGRTFEMLSASGVNQVTPQPGEKSFTRSLINCLRTLAAEPGGGSFTTRDVVERIQKERPSMPPALWRRLPGGSRHIRLSPLKHGRAAAKGPVDHPRRGFLRLGFVLKQDKLSKEQIEELTRHIPRTLNACKVPVREIKWLGFRKIENPRSFAEIAELVMQGKRRRSSHSQRFISPSPGHSPRGLSTDTLKRKRSDGMLSPDSNAGSGESKRFQSE